MNHAQCISYWVKVYLAGPIEVAKQVIRKKAKRVGMCVTIEPTTYIYTGGEEAGDVVGFIYYARFPKNSDVLWQQAFELATELKDETGQDSFTIMDPDKSVWYTDRG